MSDLATRASVLAIALDVGLIGHDDVIAWADAVIAQQSHPHGSFCELATSRGRHIQDVLDMLHAIPGEVDAGAVQDLFVGFLSESVERDPAQVERVVRVLYTIAPDLRDIELKGFAGWADDAWDLAAAGVTGTCEEVAAELRASLKDAAERAAARGRAWRQRACSGLTIQGAINVSAGGGGVTKRGSSSARTR